MQKQNQIHKHVYSNPKYSCAAPFKTIKVNDKERVVGKQGGVI